MKTINEIAEGIINLINGVLVPLVFALAFITFLFGVFKYFFAGAADEKKRSEGRQFIMWAIIAFAVMISVWGLVRVLAGTFSLDSASRPCLPTFTGKQLDCSTGNGGGSGVQEPTIPGTSLPGIY